MVIGFAEIVNFENLYAAWFRFRLGKSHRADVLVFERDLERNLLALLSDLERGTYAHGAYQTFELRDSKRRRIDKATVRDRVVHELLFRFLESVYEPLFIFDSYSSRDNKGTLCALARADVFLAPWREGSSGWYAIVADVRSFFASVPHPLLLALLARRVSDARIKVVLKSIIDSFSTGGRLGYSIPLGNVTSQVFANIVLHEIDHEAKFQLRLCRYMRYNDDILVVIHGFEEADKARYALCEVANILGLGLKVRIVKLAARTCFDWLGATYFQSGRKMRSDTVWHINRAFRRNGKRLARRHITENEYRSMVTSYLAHAKAYGTKI